MEADEVEIQAVAIVSAYVSNNSLPAADLPAFIGSVHAALAGLGPETIPEAPEDAKATPAQIRRSITPDHLISFEDGKPYQVLRRHLTTLGLSPQAYREKWGLPADYPLVAANYSARRADLARSLGLGQVRQSAAPDPSAASAKTDASAERRQRKPRAA